MTDKRGLTDSRSFD